MTDPASIRPLTDALVGGLLSLLCIATPLTAVFSEPITTKSIKLCQTSLSCTVSQGAGIVLD